MIIDDVHQMAFIHIPKCGGTSVRKQLAAVDSTGGAFYPVMDHPALGRIHASHIPLVFVRDHFADAYDRVQRYESFALIREPVDRFASATFQRLKGFRRVPPGEITPAMALQEAAEVIDWLRARRAFCDFDYIHFARQQDFVCVGGERVVRNLYALEDMRGFASGILAVSGIRLDPDRRENSNFANAHGFTRSLRRLLKPAYQRLTSWEFRERLLVRMKKAQAGRPDPLYETFRRDRVIRGFVDDYYAGDFELYEALAPAGASPDRARDAIEASPPAA